MCHCMAFLPVSLPSIKLTITGYFKNISYILLLVQKCTKVKQWPNSTHKS